MLVTQIQPRSMANKKTDPAIVDGKAPERMDIRLSPAPQCSITTVSPINHSTVSEIAKRDGLLIERTRPFNAQRALSGPQPNPDSSSRHQPLFHELIQA
jgi:hypothetical protein